MFVLRIGVGCHHPTPEALSAILPAVDTCGTGLRRRDE